VKRASSADVYDAVSYEPRKAVGYLLHRVRAEMLVALDRELSADEELAAVGVTSAQFIILATLGKGETRSAAELCKGISYDAGAMTRMIDRLEEKQLLTRQRCPEDRRLVNLELTEKGRAVLPRMRAISLSVVNRFLRGFTQAEARQLEGFLARMLANAGPG
jgi:DNA-binding MarR family transcriptional regulator